LFCSPRQTRTAAVVTESPAMCTPEHCAIARSRTDAVKLLTTGGSRFRDRA
jgi:hypothetical protein